MEKFNYQEPCCIERTLPQLLKKYEWMPFQTNGDVTVEKILKAVSHLAGNNLDITICLPAIDVIILRIFAWYVPQTRLAEVSYHPHGNRSKRTHPQRTAQGTDTDYRG